MNKSFAILIDKINILWSRAQSWMNPEKRTILWRIADIWWVLWLIVMIWWRINLSNQITVLEQSIQWNTAESQLMNYFSEIENNNLSWAFALLSDEFKQNHTYEWYERWLEYVIGFEWLKITPLTWKNTAIQQVFLVEFDFKKRWLPPVPRKRWMYVRFKWWKREINANTVLYENWRKKEACNFYPFEHCQ